MGEIQPKFLCISFLKNSPTDQIASEIFMPDGSNDEDVPFWHFVGIVPT